MAYRLAPASNPFVRFGIGAFNGYAMRSSALSGAWLFKRNSPTTGFQGIHVVDTGGATDYMYPLEFNGSNATTDTSFAGWASTATFTDTTNFMILGFTWDGTSTAGAFVWRWKIGAGAWQSETDTATAGGGVTAGSAYRHIIGNNASLSDDANIDFVCGGLIKSALSQATYESLSLSSFPAWQSVFTGAGAWLVGAEAIGTLTDRTGNGGDEVSRSAAGITLVSDPAGWSWSSSADATVTNVPADGTGALPAPGVTADATVTAPPADGTGAFPAPAVSGSADGTVTSPAADGTGDLPDPTVTAGSNVTTPAASGTGDFPAAAMDISSTVTTGPASGTGQFPAPSVAGTGDGTVTAPPADGTGDLPAPGVTAGANVTGVPASGTGAFPAPTVTGDAPVAGPPAPRTRLPSRVSSLVRVTGDRGTVRTTVMTGTARITTHNVQVWTLTLNATTRTSSVTGQGVGSRVVPQTRVTSTADG